MYNNSYTMDLEYKWTPFGILWLSTTKIFQNLSFQIQSEICFSGIKKVKEGQLLCCLLVFYFVAKQEFPKQIKYLLYYFLFV